MKRCAAWLAVAVALLSLAGCGPGGPKVYPVKGKVSYNGKPMAGGGSIAFLPKGSGQTEGKLPGGIINEDGTYEMMTHKEGDGAMEGEYRVVITQVTAKEPEPTPDGTAPPPAAAAVAPADVIPPKYSDQQNSPLTAKVEAKSNEIDFNLTP
jgi:hypothetical protein